MPIVRPQQPPEPRPHARVQRSESLKSERSDKRVSFNKDVNVKNIPRVQKTPAQVSRPNNLRPTNDEWAKCTEVYLEPTPLNSEEKQIEAEKLLQLVDNVACATAGNSLAVNTQSLDRPSRQKNKNKHYQNVLVNNANNINNNLKSGVQSNGPRTLPASRTTNPINRPIKGDVNIPQFKSVNNITNGSPYIIRHHSADHILDSDIDSPPLSRKDQRLGKSVPDLQNSVYYDNSDAQRYKYRHRVENNSDHVKSVDNLLDINEDNNFLNKSGRAVNYNSADNILEATQVNNLQYKDFKSVGNIPNSVSDPNSLKMSSSQDFRPKVGNIIKKFNVDGPRRSDAYTDNQPEPIRGPKQPNRYNNHNNNKPFSYTGATLASVEAVRRLSPPRQVRGLASRNARVSPTRESPIRESPPRELPPRESPPREPPVYAQVNKTERRSHSEGRLTNERNHHKTKVDHDYSAKIIITDDGHQPPYQNPYNHTPYSDDNLKDNYHDEDDDAYESYQVPSENLQRLIREQRILSSEDIFNDYMENNNNINMSSIGVQTDALPKAPSRTRKTPKSSSINNQFSQDSLKRQTQKSSSTNNQYSQDSLKRQYQKNEQKQNHSQQQNHRSHKNQHVANQSQLAQRRSKSEENNLSSATLVRQVNHGFGQTDRSPSPPPRQRVVQQTRKTSIVPLLSDTSDSEAEVRYRVDPLAKIREQVRQREKIQEEEEEEEEGHQPRIKDTKIVPYRKDEMTPLTIDEVDALNLEVDKRKTLVVASQEQSTEVTRTNHRSRRSEKVTERLHSPPPREIQSRPLKPAREKNHAPRNPPAVKDISTLERNRKNNLEKEKASKEAAKQKETKDKKKKRIKIKFFYDPRPQDNPNIDPLAKFQEYRGTSSDDRPSPRNNRLEEDSRDEIPVDLVEDYSRNNRRERSEEYRTEQRTEIRNEREDSRDRRGSREDIIDNSRDKRRGSKEILDTGRQTPSKDRAKSRERTTSRERGYTKEHSNDNRYSDTGSRDRRENSARREKRENSNPRRENSNPSRENSNVRRSNSTARRDSQDSRDSSKDNRIRAASRSRSRENHISHDETPEEQRNNYDEYDGAEDYDDYDERGSPDGKPRRKLSDKYLSTQLYDPPDDTHNVVDDLTAEPVPPTDEDEKEKKIQRQRKKFFSAFMSDSKAKATSSTVQNSTQVQNNSTSTLEKKKGTLPSNKKNKAPSPPKQSPPDIVISSPDTTKQQTPEKKKPPVKKKKKRSWPWAFLGLRGSGGARAATPTGGSSLAPPSVSGRGPSRASSRASSRATSRASSHRLRRPSVRASKIRREGPDGRMWFNRERDNDPNAEESQKYESSTLNRSELKSRQTARNNAERSQSSAQKKYSAESSESSTAPTSRVTRTTSFKQRYFGDTDTESRSGGVSRGNSAVADYRSLPNRSSRAAAARKAQNNNRRNGPRGQSPGAVGSAGSSLQSSESEADSHGGSHASRASKVSHVSTGSNRSVYLHATAVADIPVRRTEEEAPSDRSVSRQTKKVSRSFSLLAPWKPRHYREKFEVEYDNREGREVRHQGGHGALPPRPPRKVSDDNKKPVNRSQSMYKDNRLAGWLKRRKNKETKGI